MMTDSNNADYWLQRLVIAAEKAADAPGERSRAAYLDLARHYRSMYLMVHGRARSTSLPFEAAARAAESGGAPLQWAA
jgi:hypothetical protein